MLIRGIPAAISQIEGGARSSHTIDRYITLIFKLIIIQVEPLILLLYDF